MDTQVGLTPETEGEWVVEKILLHAGSKTDSTFEIKWKTGDITWLPYYQITHLQVLTDYLELLGESSIGTLPKGTGKPPQEDPQTYLGAVALHFHHPPIPTSSNCRPFKYRNIINNRTTLASTNISPQYMHPLHNHHHPMPSVWRSNTLHGVNHPYFV